MSVLKNSLFTLCIASVASLHATASASAQEVVWTEDFELASKQAAAEEKHVLLNFTGSDWCRYCVWMEQTVFATSEFTEYANKNLVCVTLDFPNKKPQDDGIKAQNENLKTKYGVKGFPTYIVLNPQGEKVAQLSTTSWAWRFVEKLDMAINAERHQVDIDWLDDDDFGSDIKNAVAKATAEGKHTLHFLDSSSFSSFPKSIKDEAFSSTVFKRFAKANLVLIRSTMSTMFEPVQSLDAEKKQALIGYASRRFSKSEADVTRADLDACCISPPEFGLRQEYGVTRDTLPAIAILDSEGKALKVFKGKELSDLFNDNGAKSIVGAVLSELKRLR